MTVIAWDGKTLAADKQAVNGSTKSSVKKLFLARGCLLGVTGSLSVGMEMVEWFNQGAVPDEFPKSNTSPDSGCSLVAIRPDLTVWKYESGPQPMQFEGPIVAFGSGDESALIAMACGKSAAEAVLLVQRYNTSCGMGLDILTF